MCGSKRGGEVGGYEKRLLQLRVQQLASVFLFCCVFFFATFGSTAACLEKSCENSPMFGMGASSKSLHKGFKLKKKNTWRKNYGLLTLPKGSFPNRLLVYVPIRRVRSGWRARLDYRRFFHDHPGPIQRSHGHRRRYRFFTQHCSDDTRGCFFFFFFNRKAYLVRN